MAKKHWIYVKRGLSEDPKHRAQMGECIWLYLHIIDRTDWETGICYDWRDKPEANEMAMELPTMRHQRRKLEELGYITCQQKQHGQDITIHNWNNPRDYSGAVVNTKSKNQGDNETTPSKVQGYNQGDNQGSMPVNTPSLDSKSISSLIPQERPTSIEKRGDLVQGYIDMSQASGIKKSIRIDNLESLINVRLGVTPGARRGWKPFLEFVDNRQQKDGQMLTAFLDWLEATPKFDVLFWGPDRMREHWDRAFSSNFTIQVDPDGGFYA